MEWLSSADEWKRVATDSAAAAAGVSGNMVSLSQGCQFSDMASHIDFLDKLADGPMIASRHARWPTPAEWQAPASSWISRLIRGAATTASVQECVGSLWPRAPRRRPS